MMNRGSLLLVLPAALAMAQGQTAQPESFEDLARRAEAALDSRPAEAAALYEKALALRPRWPEGWMYLGAALYQVDRYAEATDAFRRGIDLIPDQGTAWAFLGMCEAELDNPEQALTDIRKGETLGLGDNMGFEIAARVAAAQVLIRASAFNEALEQIQPLALRGITVPQLEQTMGLASMGIPSAIAELSPERRTVVELAGKAAWASGSQRPADAAAAYKELMERYPDEPGVRYVHALYLMETDLEGALAEFRQESKKNPSHWPTLLAIGSLELRSGAPNAAIRTLRSAMKLVPARQRWQAHAELGRAILAAGQVEAAVAELETARRLMPSIPQVHLYLSQAYRRAGKEQDAQKEMAEFQRLKSQQDPLGVPAK